MGAKIMQANKNKHSQDSLQTEQELTIRKHLESTFQLLQVTGLLNESTVGNIKRVMLETFQKFESDPRKSLESNSVLDLPKMSDTSTGGSGDTSPVNVKGRMSAYAFFVKICREEYEKRNTEKSFDCSECARKCPERWKEMPENEKKRFQEMADIYTGFKEEEKNAKEPRRELPKNPRCMFYWFCEEWRPILKKSHPEYGLGDISKTLGRLWRDADNELKIKYDIMAEEDKKRYAREISEYKRDLGIESDEESE